VCYPKTGVFEPCLRRPFGYRLLPSLHAGSGSGLLPPPRPLRPPVSQSPTGGAPPEDPRRTKQIRNDSSRGQRAVKTNFAACQCGTPRTSHEAVYWICARAEPGFVAARRSSVVRVLQSAAGLAASIMPVIMVGLRGNCTFTVVPAPGVESRRISP